MKNSIAKSLFWKLTERFGVSGLQFLLQLILARLLDPEYYGVLAIMVVFTSLANVFVQTGFNTALIQNKDVTEEDYSSVLWITLLIALVAYFLIFFCAPLIASFYRMPSIITPLRVLSLMLFPGALNSIQLAKISRDMDFQKVFTSSICGVIVSGIAGILIAFLGGGLWALVIQNLVNVFVTCLVMRFTVHLKLRFIYNAKRVKILFRFGWKLLLSSLLDTLYNNLNGLVIGRKYHSGILAFYERGRQFPGFLMDAINGAIQSVMLPAMSAEQNNKQQLRDMLRNSMMASAYVVMPMMAGLSAISTPLISLLLTDKWLPCVPYLQVCCFISAFFPIHSCNLQAINAIGRSDIFLILEMIKKSYSIALLFIAVFFFDSPLAIASVGIVTTLISWIINAYPNKQFLGYSFLNQFQDLLPTFFMSATMFVFVKLIGLIQLPLFFIIILQIFAGVTIYLLLSIIITPPAYVSLLAQISRFHLK